MSKKITLYELLGLIKDEKELPEKIKFHGAVYVLESEYEYCKDYYNEEFSYLFNDNWPLTNNLNEEVEILKNTKKIEYREDKITIVKYIGEGSFIEKGSYGVLLESGISPHVKWFKEFNCCYVTYVNGKLVENVWGVSLDNLELVSVIDK